MQEARKRESRTSEGAGDVQDRVPGNESEREACKSEEEVIKRSK